tara:strand:+ start:9688 stop:10113 length:426 start_codon:yes stop_codon:yes gene_type:complete
MSRKYNLRPSIPASKAVFEVLDSIGDQSSLAVLVKEAKKLTRKNVSIESACVSRRNWRKEHGLNTDARTYKGQPERNMTKALAAMNITTADIPKATGLLKTLRIGEDALSDFFRKMGGARKAYEVIVAIKALRVLGVKLAA